MSTLTHDEILAALVESDITIGQCINALSEKNSEIETVFINTAIDMYLDEGTIEIDAPSIASVSDDGGAYVLAWVWVSNRNAGLPDPDDDDEEPLAEDDDCDDRCLPHAKSCDGYCDHTGHKNACRA